MLHQLMQLHCTCCYMHGVVHCRAQQLLTTQYVGQWLELRHMLWQHMLWQLQDVCRMGIS